MARGVAYFGSRAEMIVTRERQVGDWTLYKKLFEEVGYYEWFHRAISSSTYITRLEFIHLVCHSDMSRVLRATINEDGYCSKCGKFIATIEKLDTMVGLKEVVGDIDG